MADANNNTNPPATTQSDEATAPLPAKKPIQLRQPPLRELDFELSRKVAYAEDPVAAYDALPEDEQKLVLAALLKDCKMQMTVPRADWAVFSLGGKCLLSGDAKQKEDEEEDVDEDYDHDNPFEIGESDRRVKPDGDGHVDLAYDPYCLRKFFRRQWRIAGTAAPDADPVSAAKSVLICQKPAVDDQNHTSDTTDVAATPEQRPKALSWSSFNLCRRKNDGRLATAENYWKIQREGSNLTDTYFHRDISAQLLLYRVAQNLGPIPGKAFTEVDSYKGCWSVQLEYVGGGGVLELYDHKGAASVSFDGSGEEESRAALQLVDWLVGDNCPNSYDYAAAGAVA